MRGILDYLLEIELQNGHRNGFRVTNYDEFLEISVINTEITLVSENHSEKPLSQWKFNRQVLNSIEKTFIKKLVLEDHGGGVQAGLFYMSDYTV